MESSDRFARLFTYVEGSDLMSLIFCVLRILQVTHPFGCCRNNMEHAHLLGVGHRRRVDGSRRGVCSDEEAHDLQRASVTHVPIVELKLRHNCIDVLNHVLEIRRTSCTRADSESVSDCAVPSRFDRE